MSKNIIMMSLYDSKIKKVANVVSNNTCKKIIEYLAGKEYATESGISKELKLPISTVHYNLQQLVEVGLISADKYHYSEKGREVNCYKLANKYIIIAPKEDGNSLKKRLREVLPVAIIVVFGAALLHAFNYFLKKISVTGKNMVLEESMGKIAKERSMSLVSEVLNAVPLVNRVEQWHNAGLWFFIGGIFAVFIFVILKKNDLR